MHANGKTGQPARWPVRHRAWSGPVLRPRRGKRYGTGAKVFRWAMVAVSSAFSIYAAMQATPRAYLLLAVLALVGGVPGVLARRGADAARGAKVMRLEPVALPGLLDAAGQEAVEPFAK